MVGAQLAGARHERADVLRQAATPEAQTGVEVATADPRVVSQRVGEQRDVRVDGFAYLGDRVDERNLGGQKGVRRHLDQFGGLQVGRQQERHILGQQWCVQLANRRLGANRIPLHPKDDTVRAQRVVNGEALPKKFRIPRRLDIHAGRGQPTGAFVELGRRAHRHGGLADDHRRAAQSRNEFVDHRMHMTQIGTVFALLLRCSDAEEMQVGEFGGCVVVSGEAQAVRQRGCRSTSFADPARRMECRLPPAWQPCPDRCQRR